MVVRLGDNNMTEELKPCPFCGGRAEIQENLISTPYFDGFLRIICIKCRASPFYEKIKGNKKIEILCKRLIKVWNRRVKE
jgi:C4-type Zn-finger protein